jgi:dipeptidase E
MPIVYPHSFDALGLIPFNINPHYIDPDPGSKHMGETRETRIAEFHVYNELPVVGLREGTALEIHGDELHILGDHSVRVFRKRESPAEVGNAAELKRLVFP